MNPTKNIAFLAFITNCIKILLEITAALLQMMKKIYETLCKLLLQIEVPLQQTTTENYYKLRHIYYKLQQKNITNYIKNLLQITPAQISSNYW